MKAETAFLHQTMTKLSFWPCRQSQGTFTVPQDWSSDFWKVEEVLIWVEIQAGVESVQSHQHCHNMEEPYIVQHTEGYLTLPFQQSFICLHTSTESWHFHSTKDSSTALKNSWVRDSKRKAQCNLLKTLPLLSSCILQALFFSNYGVGLHA